MSTPIVARVARENRSILATRKSSCDTRSPYICPGSRRLIVTFALPPDSGRPSDCATTALGTFQVNQELAPADFSFNGAVWKDLGAYSITGTTLVVRLTDLADEYVIADAVRIERLS